MVIIRLSKTGRKKVATYRIVAMDSRKRRDGRVIERLGHYEPMARPATFKINHERALYWLQRGAQVSDTVKSLFHRDGVVKKFQLLKKGLDATEIAIERKLEKGKKPAKSKKTLAKEKAAAEEAAKAKEEDKAEGKVEAKVEAKEEPKPEAKAEEEVKQEPKPEGKAEEEKVEDKTPAEEAK